MEALSDPNDTEKRKRANECLKNLQHKRWLPRCRGDSQDPSLPVEWLHPKQSHHINSLDSLLLHEDLVRDYLKGGTSRHTQPSPKDVIETALFDRSITKWEGVVSEISSDRKGIISMKKHIEVAFVPINVQPRMPNEGDEVRFCLAFHWTGPNAWSVVCQPGAGRNRKAVAHSRISSSTHPDDDPGSDTGENSGGDDDDDLLPLVGESLHNRTFKSKQNMLEQVVKGYHWGYHLDQQMQGIILKRSSERGIGWIYNPNFHNNLFFHVKQIFPPVISLESIALYSVVSFTVGKSERGPRAMNIKTVVGHLHFLVFILNWRRYTKRSNANQFTLTSQ